MTTAVSVLRRLVAQAARTPVLRFVALGALLFAIRFPAAPVAPSTGTPIVVSADDVARYRREWDQREGGPLAPPPSDRALIDEALDEEVLLREALARQFDRDDPVVRARLIRLARYLGLAENGTDETLEREARTLGLQRSDEVVRRHLVEMMRLAAAKPGPADLPTEAELRAYFESHAGRFAEPARVRLTHVYLSRERRGAHLDADAATLLASLQRGAVDPRAAGSTGDPFVRGDQRLVASAAELDRTFGPGFAAAVTDLPERAWSRPIASAYGLHIVWIDARLPAGLPSFAAVRSRVLHQYLDERSAARLQAKLRTWRARYAVRLEG